MQVLVKFGVVGMNDHQNSEFANIYPNPFKQVFEVDIQGAGGHVVNCLLYGTDGRLVVTKVERVDQKIILDAGSIEAGIYLLQIRTESGVWYKKIIKE